MHVVIDSTPVLETTDGGVEHDIKHVDFFRQVSFHVVYLADYEVLRRIV